MTSLRCILAAVLTLAAAAPLQAVAATARPARSAPPRVDLTGVYIGLSREEEATSGHRPTPWPSPPPYTAEGEKWALHWAQPLNNLGLKCLPWWGPIYVIGGTNNFPVEIIQKPSQVTLIMELMSMTRRVYTDGSALPTDLESSWMGYSVGHWEGDTLVIETAGVRAGLANGSGSNVQGPQREYRIPYSPTTRLQERVRAVEGGRYLEVETTLTDPVLYTRPIKTTRYLKRAPDMKIFEYVCAENQRPEDGGAAPQN